MACALKTLDFSGALCASLIGAVILTFLGWSGFGLLIAFFLLGTLSTRYGYGRKKLMGVAQSSAGRRSAANVLANGLVPTFCAVAAGISSPSFSWAFVGSLAAVTADTLESEIGVLSRGEPRLITSMRQVPRGTDGAVSFLGTAAGFAGALTIGTLGWALGLLPGRGVPVVALAGWVATFAESALGAVLERRGALSNGEVNFLNSLIGGLLAGVVVASV